MQAGFWALPLPLMLKQSFARVEPLFDISYDGVVDKEDPSLNLWPWSTKPSFVLAFIESTKAEIVED